jgi:crotonobetainyl-CoA:carnitine CoA-transferase CaiB-like acyl-CoA transferase
VSRDEFLKLVDTADVLLETFRPGVMARLGPRLPTLSARNARLVYCALSGYGIGGPLEQAAGHERTTSRRQASCIATATRRRCISTRPSRIPPARSMQ